MGKKQRIADLESKVGELEEWMSEQLGSAFDPGVINKDITALEATVEELGARIGRIGSFLDDLESRLNNGLGEVKAKLADFSRQERVVQAFEATKVIDQIKKECDRLVADTRRAQDECRRQCEGIAHQAHNEFKLTIQSLLDTQLEHSRQWSGFQAEWTELKATVKSQDRALKLLATPTNRFACESLTPDEMRQLGPREVHVPGSRGPNPGPQCEVRQ